MPSLKIRTKKYEGTSLKTVTKTFNDLPEPVDKAKAKAFAEAYLVFVDFDSVEAYLTTDEDLGVNKS